VVTAPQHTTRRRGITLVELLLVLTLLVIVGSLSAPAVTSSFASVRLRRAGDKIIACWANARARAIETGVPRQFRFMPESGQACVEPASIVPADPALAAASPAADPTLSTPATSAADPAATDPLASQSGDYDAAAPTVNVALAEPIKFHSGEAQVEDPLTQERRVDPLAPSSGSSWSLPILFFPDGSASHASIVLTNDRNQFLRLTLRGLTGTARASEVLTREELDRATSNRR
jgi:type II secretory pathway pseudopilin PulG